MHKWIASDDFTVYKPTNVELNLSLTYEPFRGLVITHIFVILWDIRDKLPCKQEVNIVFL